MLPLSSTAGKRGSKSLGTQKFGELKTMRIQNISGQQKKLGQKNWGLKIFWGLTFYSALIYFGAPKSFWVKKFGLKKFGGPK